MKYDEKAPDALVEMQKWFADVITLPIAPDQKLPKDQIEKEAARYINTSKTLLPYQRIEIYHQQYWFRLIDILAEIYPTLARLFGVDDFAEEIAIPYLSQNPPKHWSLAQLGEDLPDWLEQHYQGIDALFVLRLSRIDRAFQRAFLAPKTLPVAFDENLPLSLASHVHLFELNSDLFSFRQALLDKPIEYWQNHPFPDIACGTFYFLLFRNHANEIEWHTLSRDDYIFLKKINSTTESTENTEKN